MKVDGHDGIGCSKQPILLGWGTCLENCNGSRCMTHAQQGDGDACVAARSPRRLKRTALVALSVAVPGSTSLGVVRAGILAIRGEDAPSRYSYM